MLAVVIAVSILIAAVAGVYLLLKGMGEDGVEAAAPGSCRSGRCGVKPEAPPEVQVISLDNLRRPPADRETH